MMKRVLGVAMVLSTAGCQAAPTLSWTTSLMGVHAFFQLGRQDGPVVAIPIADIPQSGSGSSSSGGSTSVAPPPPPPVYSGGGGSSGPPPAPPTPTPVATSNTLDAGPGAIAGIVVDVVHGGTPVTGVVLTVISSADPTKRAVLLNGADGRYGVAGVALGTYTVMAEKRSFAAGTQAVEVILYPGSPECTTVNLALSP